jgi:hypothetical protein
MANYVRRERVKLIRVTSPKILAAALDNRLKLRPTVTVLAVIKSETAPVMQVSMKAVAAARVL